MVFNGIRYGRIPEAEFQRILKEFARNRRTRARDAEAFARRFPGLTAAAGRGAEAALDSAETDLSGTDIDTLERAP